MNASHPKSDDVARTSQRLSVEGLRTPVVGPYSLSLAAGECVVLTGPSGSGKSLLLRAICDLDPSTGMVFLNGRMRDDFPPRDWRRSVGLLPAEPAWWAEVVGEHFPQGSDGVLEALGFGPEVMGWEVMRASSGERQRLALARMLQLRPQVLLLDEPTANLDADNRARVESVVREYLADSLAAALWVTHDPAQASRVGDRELVMRAGQLEEIACI
ncbi:ATP-binding protein [Acidihalobacter yilgarnensis]|uniref:ATP-binding protein n=1 Tax=Acidihalobacter yilgarnensis TaxID=2819280 RepID=A0A1D8IRZ6_9GAMM|nr:ATP-binding cassette domain-containing protein [Acidihalobacter yilgarnensis]AOU99177.1 ATP-binding protein [Acidihalobacter yilgarnensis]